MKFYKVIPVTDDTLIYSNILEDDHPEWSSAVDYAIGTYVMSLTTHTIYRALVESGPTGAGAQDPDAEQIALADPLIEDPATIYWQVMSATNRWMAFDDKPTVQAQNADTIEYSFQPGQIVTGIAAFNVNADTMRIVVNDPTAGVVYDETISLVDDSEVYDWWTYYFAPISYVYEVVVTDLPPYSAATITVTFDKTGGTALVGQVAFGLVRDIGFVEVKNSGFSGIDFSYVQNDDFGNLITVPRVATRLAEYDVVVETNRLLAIDRALQNLRGGASAVWIGDDDSRKAAVTFGFYRTYRVIYAEGDYSLLNIQVQGKV